MFVFRVLLFVICCLYFVFTMITRATDRITFWYMKVPILAITGGTIVYMLMDQYASI